jgi:hypothetical protein
MTDIASILADVSRATQPVAVIRDLVLQQGGSWCDPSTNAGIFEVQLAGLVGIGPSQAAAVDDWIVQARQAMQASASAAE